MENLLIWVGLFIFLILGLFYFLLKAVKTKNIKYTYPIVAMLLLMIGMFFL